MRQLGLGVRLYVDENEDYFPRSQHSAFANGALPWGRSIAPQLGSSTVAWTNLLKGVYHCPSDKRATPWSYGFNAYFEFGADDDYLGKPQTWQRSASVPNPSASILFSENASQADHIMANYWVKPSDAVDVPEKRHKGRSNFTFVDGHSENRKFATTYSPTEKLDSWNPSLAK
jgi:prepilin-type processing-associated H-X9-DG protein